MRKMTIYLPADLKTAINLAARRRGISGAEVIRDSMRRAIGAERPHPRGGLFASGAPIARQADDHLAGFGHVARAQADLMELRPIELPAGAAARSELVSEGRAE